MRAAACPAREGGCTALSRATSRHTMRTASGGQRQRASAPPARRTQARTGVKDPRVAHQSASGVPPPKYHQLALRKARGVASSRRRRQLRRAAAHPRPPAQHCKRGWLSARRTPSIRGPYLGCTPTRRLLRARRWQARRRTPAPCRCPSAPRRSRRTAGAASHRQRRSVLRDGRVSGRALARRQVRAYRRRRSRWWRPRQAARSRATLRRQQAARASWLPPKCWQRGAGRLLVQ